MTLIKFNISTVLGLLTAAMLTVALATSCTSDTPTSPNQHRDVWLSFEISSPSAKQRMNISRATDDGGHEEETSFDAENHINLSDIKILLLDGNDLVINVLDNTALTVISGDYNRNYELKARIDLSAFDYAQGENIPMGLMMIANISGTGHPSTTINNNQNLLIHTTHSISGAYHSFGYATDEDGTWLPSTAEGGKHIPMSGLKKFTIRRSGLESSSADSPYQITANVTAQDANPLEMQRAMAKIRVIDNIPEGLYRIKSVALVGYNTYGTYLPDFETTKTASIDWSAGTVDVETPTVRAEWFSADSKAVLTLIENEYSENDQKVTPAFITYVPECSSTALALEIITSDGYQEKSYTISLNESTKISKIVRNHIYEFEVTMEKHEVVGIKPALYVTVCPWENETVDVPTFD